MSLAYCFDCLERIDEVNPNCKHHGEEIIYGDIRTDYIRGYRDAQEGKEMDL